MRTEHLDITRKSGSALRDRRAAPASRWLFCVASRRTSAVGATLFLPSRFGSQISARIFSTSQYLYLRLTSQKVQSANHFEQLVLVLYHFCTNAQLFRRRLPVTLERKAKNENAPQFAPLPPPQRTSFSISCPSSGPLTDPQSRDF
jgi:hypothetical protein